MHLVQGLDEEAPLSVLTDVKHTWYLVIEHILLPHVHLSFDIQLRVIFPHRPNCISRTVYGKADDAVSQYVNRFMPFHTDSRHRQRACQKPYQTGIESNCALIFHIPNSKSINFIRTFVPEYTKKINRYVKNEIFRLAGTCQQKAG